MAWSVNMDWNVFFNSPSRLKDLYLKRLDVTEEKPSREYLDMLIKKHQQIIPFENIDVTDFNHPVDIRPEALVEKILIKGRGGFCYELNGLFVYFLRALGFDAWMCPSRQLRHTEDYPVPATHCGILVNISGRHLFADVGYGGPGPRGSIDLDIEEEQTVDEDVFILKDLGIYGGEKINAAYRHGSGWLTLIRKPDLALVTIGRLQYLLQDFYGNVLVRSTGNTAYSVRHASIKLPGGGYYDLTGNILKIKRNGRKKQRSIDNKDLKRVLNEYFGIRDE